jgi:hypothetical protein
MSDRCHDAPIYQKMQELYTKLALDPGEGFPWGTGRENARALGYNERWLELLPVPVWESAAAVGLRAWATENMPPQPQ